MNRPSLLLKYSWGGADEDPDEEERATLKAGDGECSRIH